jgi:hypothetical protein
MTGKHNTVPQGLTIIQMGLIHFLLDNGRRCSQKSRHLLFRAVRKFLLRERVFYATPHTLEFVHFA